MEDMEIKIILSKMLYMNNKPLEMILRYILFDLCVNVIDWQKVYEKITEQMPELKGEN